MIHTDTYDCRYYESLDEAKADGYTPVKATSVLSFFRLSNKCRVISTVNVVPFTDVLYMVRAKAQERYYIKTYRNYDIDTMFFYYQKEGNEKEEVESLLRYISDGNVYILFTAEDLSEIKDMITRCYKHKFNGEPPEKWSSLFYSIMREVLRYEDYQKKSQKPTNYLTVCKQFELRINELWNTVYQKTQTK